MKKPIPYLLLLSLAIAGGCSRDDSSEPERADAPPESEQAPAEENERAAVPAAPVDTVARAQGETAEHRRWRIGVPDAGDFTQQLGERDRIPRGLVHRYEFEVVETGRVLLLVYQHLFYADHASPTIDIFRLNGDDLEPIELPTRDVPEDEPFEIRDLPNGSYEIEEGHALVFQDLEPGEYVFTVTPAEADMFHGRNAGRADFVDSATYICLSECEHCTR